MNEPSQGKPFSQACENNREPIFNILAPLFQHQHRILEVGSGTGQHAVYMAPKMPQLQWQTSDLPENIAGINRWIDAEQADNVLRPFELDINSNWPNAELLSGFDGLYSANTLHIMPWPTAQKFIAGLADMPSGAVVTIYGPFKYQGEFTSASNARFEQWLKQQEPHRGIRDFEQVNALAEQAGLELLADHNMPANNQLLVWRKAATE